MYTELDGRAAGLHAFCVPVLFHQEDFLENYGGAFSSRCSTRKPLYEILVESLQTVGYTRKQAFSVLGGSVHSRGYAKNCSFQDFSGAVRSKGPTKNQEEAFLVEC